MDGMPGGLTKFDTMMKNETRKIKSMKRLEKSLDKRRKQKSRSKGKPVEAAATHPVQFALDEFERTSTRDLVKALKQLISTKMEGRHAFLACESCARRAILVAPKRNNATADDVLRTLAPKRAVIATNERSNELRLVPLMTLSSELTTPLFRPDLTCGTLTGASMVSVGRLDVAGSVLFTLHGYTTTEGVAVPATPSALGLSSMHFRALQKDAAKLLGMQLLSEWTL